MRFHLSALWTCLLACFPFIAPLSADDSVTLNSGEVIQGRIVSDTNSQIEIETANENRTILTTRTLLKADIKAIARETQEQKAERSAYEALAKYQLNPNQEFSSNYCLLAIANFKKFLSAYPQSAFASGVGEKLREWKEEQSHVATGQVKFANRWMTPAERKVQAERRQRQADVESSQNALRSLKKQLADLQAQRGALAENIGATQAKLTAAQANLTAFKDTTESSGRMTVNSGGRPGLAGRLTQRINAPTQTETDQGTTPPPEKTQLPNNITSYQQQVSREQAAIGSLDAKIQDVRSQIPKLEQDAKLALERLSEAPAEVRTNLAQYALPKDTRQGEANAPVKLSRPSAPKSEPAPPWYMRVWKWLHG